MTSRQTVVVPAEVVGELRTGLYEQIDIAAEELDLLTMRADREHHPERYHKPLRDLDRVRSLLDAIRWRPPGPPPSVEINLCEHQWALCTALATSLQTIEGLECQTDAIREGARAIRAFLHSVQAQERG